MMTREHHRRRSPDSRRRRKERRDSREQLQSQQIPVPIPRYEEQFEPIETRSRALSSISSSSSTSSSLLNISRPSNRFGFTSFFTGHTRKQRRVKRRRSGLFRGRNSSSSSVNSDLAYGRGYIRRRKSREFSPPNSPGRHPGRPSVKQRAQTDEEILELGRQFAEIARQQNAEDLRAAGRTRPSTLVGAAAALSSFRRTNSGNSVRGVGSSKPRRDSSPDDSEWESASDDESSSGEFDSGLAYGSTSNLPPAPSKAIQAIQPLSPITSPRSLQAPIHSPQLRRKRSLVDPNLFGPVNSLRGYVEEPCGFERVDRTSLSEPRPSRPYEPSIPPSETLSEGRPLQRVFPVPTSDPSRFDATRGSVVSSQQDLATPARPAPVPIQPTLQQPRPIAPVSRKVLDSVETDSRYSDRSSSKKALGEAAIAGIAGAAVGAALSSDRKDDRDRHEGRRDREGKRRSKRSEADFQEDKSEKRKSREAREVREVRDERPEKRRERRSELDRDLERERHYREMVVPEVARESEKERHRLDKYHNDAHDNDQVRDKGEYDRKEERKIDRAEDRREERREQRREERREERREVERARRSDSEGYKRLDGPKYASQKGPIDPFQFQVADDAFPTPLHTTPKRPLTPNVITVDREPDFSRFEASGDDSRPLERLSRKDSYERELRDAQKVYEATEHATAPVSGAAFAAAAAAVIAEDRRGRSRSRGSDASSRNRSRRGDSPKREKDAVQEDADRYYREAELARRIREEEKRSRTSSESSVVEKWKQTQQPVVDLTSPPEMEHEKEKKKSPYDGPDADVRIDNVLEHPSELSRFQTSSTRGLSSIPVFIARDPSAERERPMLNLVRPTPIHTPVPEKQKATEESRSEPAKKVDDVSVSKSAPDVAPVPTPKAVSWGENQTKHYVVESPEIEDDPYSGTKVVTPAKTPRSRSGKKSGWGFIASALSGAGDEAASSTASTAARDIEGPKPRHTLRDGEKSTTRRSSISFESPDDSPPIPGPKPPSPRSSQMPGAFAEDPAFTANIAAALEGSGFDPNIVIDNANFHRRDSPPGSNDSGVYQSPFVESVTDLGITNAPRSAASVISREPGFVMGEVPETPDEKDSSTRNSQILSMLKEQREQDDAKKPEATTDDTKAAESPRSVAEDDWSKLSKKERKRREKAAKAQTLVDDKAIDNTSRKEQDLEAEFIGAPADEDEDSSLKKKKSKKSKKAVVVQDESREPTLAESTQVVVPVDAFRDVQDAKTVQSEDAWDLPKESRRRSKPELDALTTSSTSTRATEFRSDISRKSIDTDFTTPDDEWEMSRKDSYRSRRSSDGYSPSRPVLASDLSRESSYRVIDSDSIPATEEEWDTPRKSKKSSRRSRDFDSPPRSAAASEASLEFVRRTTDSDIASLPDTPKRSRKTRRATIDDEFAAPISAAQSVEDLGTTEKSKKSKRDSGAYDSPSRVEPPAEDIVESPKEMSESFSEFRRDRSGTLEEGFDTPKKSKKSKRSSIGYEDLPSTPRSAAPSEVSVGSSRKSKQDVYADSPTRSAPPSEIGTDDSRKKSKKKKRRSTASELPEDGKSAEESEPPDRGKGRFEAQDRDVSSVVSVPIHFEEHRSSRSRVRADTLDDTKSVTSAPGGSDRKISRSDKDKRGSGTSSFFDRFRSSIGMVEDARKSEGDKKSFLDNAGTLGAGVGSTGAAVTPASQESRSNATNAPLEEESQTVPFTPERQSTSREVDFIDPEIVPREIRPAIDPKYGDLLPLPPSLPGSPVAELGEDFPPLPDSRPESPEHERHIREVPTHNRRRSTQDTPTRPKTPSQSAIPIQFRLGHKRTPSRSSPSVSPTTGGSEFGSESRRRASSRPTSWEGSREFKPLLLLLKNSRNSVDASSSPERDYSPGEKFASPSSSETREDSAYALSRLSGRSPDCDSPLRDAAVATPVASTPRELSEASDLKRASDVVSLPRHEYPFGQLSDEHPHQRSHKADEFHLEPLPEQPALESAEDVELPPQKPEPIELLNPATEIPSSDFYTPLVEARDPIDANISQISLPLVPALKSTEPADIAEEAPKDKQDDIAPLPEIVTPAADEPEAATVLDDHTLRQGDLAKHLETHDKDSSLLDVIPESKTPNSVDSFGTARSVADDIGSAQLSRFLEELGDYSHTRKAMSDDGDEFLEASSNIGTPLVQEEAPKFEQALPIQEEAPVQEEDRAIQDEAPLVQDDDLYTQQAVPFSDIGRELTSEPAPIAEQVERSVLEEVSTKDTPQTSEQATLDTKPEEAPAPPKSRILSALAALRSGWGSKETPKDTPKETIVTRQPEPEPEPEPELEPATAPEPEPEPQLEPELKPEPEPESLDVQQDTGSTSKKGKKKKKKKSKSQTTELSLEDAPSVSNTQNVGLGETSTQIIVDDAPADSTSASIEGVRSIEEKPILVEEPATIEVEPVPTEEMTSITERDISTTKPELVTPALESTAIEAEPHAVEMSPPETSTVEQESTSVEPELTSVELETPATEPGVAAPIPKIPSSEPEPTIAEAAISTTEADLESAIIKPELTATENEPSTVKPEPSAQLGDSTVEPEVSTELERVDTELGGPASEKSAILPSEIPSTEPESTPTEPRDLAVEATEAEPVVTEPQPVITEPEPAAENEPSVVETETTAQHEIPPPEPEVVPADQARGEVESEAIVPESEPLSTPVLETDDIRPEPTPVNPVVEAIENELAAIEPAATEVEVQETPAILPEVTAVEREVPIVEAGVEHVEKEPIVPGSDVPAIEPESTIIQTDLPATEKEAFAELEPTSTQGTTSVEPELAPPMGGKPEEIVAALERSASVSKKGKKKKKGKQQASLEKDQPELASSIEEPAGPVDEVKQEVVEENPEPPVVEPQTFHQDQPEVIASEEPRDVEPSISEETPQPTKKSKKKKKGKKTQVAEPEPETEAAGGQIPAQDEESQPPSDKLPSLSTLPEDDSALQAETQNLESTSEQPVETSFGLKETETPNVLPDNEMMSKVLPVEESTKLSEPGHEGEKSQETVFPKESVELATTEPSADITRDLQPTSPGLGQEEHLQSTPGPILEEIKTLGDSVKPEEPAGLIADDGPNVDQQHEDQPTLTETSLQDPIEQAPGGSESLEHANVDESRLQPNVPSGEHTGGQQDPASIDPPEAPLVEASSTEDVQAKSPEQIGAVEEPAASNVVADDAQPSSLPGENIVEETQEMALSQPESGSKKKGKKSKKKRQGTSEIVDTPPVAEPTEEPQKPQESPQELSQEPTQEPVPETASQETPSEAKVNEPSVASDAPEKPSEESAEALGDDASQELASPVKKSKKGKKKRQSSNIVDPSDQSEASKPEESSTEPQPDVEISDKPVIEQPEPIGEDIKHEVEGSSKDDQTTEAPILTDEPESLKPTEELVEEPPVVERALSGDVEAGQTIDDSQVPTSEIGVATDVATGGQLEKDQTPETETAPGKKKKKKDKKKRGSTQIDTAPSDTLQGTSENLVAKDDTNDGAIPLTESAVDDDKVGGETQVDLAKEETEKKDQSDLPTDTEKTPVSPLIAQNISAEPSATPENITEATKEESDIASTSTETKKSKKDKKKKKRQSVQFTEPLEQSPTEAPTEEPTKPAMEFPSDDTTFNTDWQSAKIPPVPDFGTKSEDGLEDSSKTEPEPLQDQPIDPLDQLIQHIETKEQPEIPTTEEDKSESRDVPKTIDELPIQKDAEGLEDTGVDTIRDQPSAETLPKRELDETEQPLGDATASEQQAPDDQALAEPVIVQEAATHDEVEVAPVVLEQEHTLPAETGAEETPVLPDEPAQPVESKVEEIVQAPQQVDGPTAATTASLKEDQSRDLTESSPSDLSAEPTSLAQDAAPAIAEEEPPAASKKSKKDKKKRKSKVQELIDSIEGTMRPREEPRDEPTKGESSTEVPTTEVPVEVPTEEPVELPPTALQDQTELGHIASDVPITAEPEELAPQPQEDDSQGVVAKKSKKDKKKKKRASQTQEPESSTLPTDEPTVERPRSPTGDDTQPQDIGSVEVPPNQEIETKQPTAEQEPSVQSDLPATEVPKAADTSDTPVQEIQEPSPRLADVVDMVVQNQKAEREPVAQNQKAGDDVLTGEAGPETAPSGDITDSHGQEETRQLNDFNDLTKTTVLEKEEPVTGLPEVDKEDSEAVIAPKKKGKKKKKRDSQATLEATQSVQDQDIPESTPDIQAPVDKDIASTESDVPLASQDVSVPPPEQVDEPSETITATAEQETSASIPSDQPAVNVKEIADTEPQAPEQMITEESKEGEDNKQVTLEEAVAPEQTTEQPSGLAPIGLATDEQTGIDSSTLIEISKDEESISIPVEKVEEGKIEQDRALDNSAPQLETSDVPIEVTRDISEIPTGASTPQPDSKDEVVADPEPSKKSKKSKKKKKGSRSEDIQPQEEPSQIESQPAILPEIAETLEVEAAVPEIPKDDTALEAIPAEKGDEDKGKQPEAHQDDNIAPGEEPVPIADELPTDSPKAEEADAKEPLVPTLESTKDEVPADTKSAKKKKKDKKKKKASALEPEPEPSTPAEPEPSVATQPAEPPMETVPTVATPIDTAEVALVEEGLSTDLSETLPKSTGSDEAAVVPTQDDASLTEGLSTARPAEVAEEQVIQEPLPESTISVQDPIPAEDTTTAPIIGDTNIKEDAQLEEPATTSQLPEEQPKEIVPSSSLEIQELVPSIQEPEQLVEQADEVVQIVVPESEPVAETEPIPVQSEEPLGLEDSLKSAEPTLTEEPPKPDELAQAQESSKPEEPTELEKVPKPEEHVKLDEAVQQEEPQPELTEQESSKAEEPIPVEELAQPEEPTQQPSELEKPALAEESVPPAGPSEVVEEPSTPVVEAEATPAKKSKKDKKRKKKASRAEPEPEAEPDLEAKPEPEPEPILEDAQLVEEPQERTVLPEQSTDAPLEQPAAPSTEQVQPEELIKPSESPPVAEDLAAAPKDGENTEEAAPEVSTSKKSKKKKKRASQIEPEPEPTPEVIPSLEEPAEQSTSPQEPQESQPQESQQEPQEIRDIQETQEIQETPKVQEIQEVQEVEIPESQILQQADTQPITEGALTTSTDIAKPEDVLPEVSTSKKSKKKKKRASQIDQQVESGTATPSEPQEQPVLLDEPLVQEPTEQTDKQPEAEEPTALAEEKAPEEILPEVATGKKSKKEKRKSKKAAALAAEPEPETKLETEAERDIKVEDGPSATEIVSAHTEQPEQSYQSVEPIVEPSQEVEVLPTSDATPAVPEESPQQPTVEAPEADSSTQFNQDHVSPPAEEREVSAPTDGKDLALKLEQDIITPQEEVITRDTPIETPLDSVATIVTEAPQEPEVVDELSQSLAKDADTSNKDIESSDIPEPSTKDVPNADLLPQDLQDTEKQIENPATIEDISAEEKPQVEHSDIPIAAEIPEALSTEQQQLSTDQVLPEASLPKEPEPEPEASPISRKKSKKKKKKGAAAQAESEPVSGTQTPATEETIPAVDPNKAAATEVLTQEPEKAIEKEGEWLESPAKSTTTEKRHKASGTSTPMESMEDVPAEAPPDTEIKENAPGRLTLEDISEVEGQSSTAKDVQKEEILPKPKHQDENAEDFNISHPAKEIVEVSEDNQLTASAKEDRLAQLDEGLVDEIERGIPEDVQILAPTSRPRTPTTVAPPMINIDLSPAQLSSHVEHDRPFDQSPQPGKKIKTHLSSDDTIAPKSLSTQADVATENIEGSNNGAPGLLPPAILDITQAKDSNVALPDLTPAREIAISYLESQPISMDDNLSVIEQKRDVEQVDAAGLLPVITPQQEISTSYFEEHSQSEVPIDDSTKIEDDLQPQVSPTPISPPKDVSISHPEPQPMELDTGHVKEKSLPIEPKETRQPSPTQETTPSAHEVAAALMESHFAPSEKEKETTDDANATTPETTSASPPTGGALLSPDTSSGSKKAKKGKKNQKYVDKRTLDTDDMFDDPSLWESSQPKSLQGGGRLDADAGSFWAGLTAEAEEQAKATPSDIMRPEPSENPPIVNTTIESVESPVVGREIQHDLPKPRNVSHDSPTPREPPTTEIIEKLDDLDTSEPVNEPSELTRELKADDTPLKSLSPGPSIQDFMSSGRASPRVLPPIEEETHRQLENEGRGQVHDTKKKAMVTVEPNRDSGFITDSPTPMRRSLVDDPGHRDSGVHLRDWPESTPKKPEVLSEEEQASTRTPQPNEKRTKKLGLGSETPKLSTPVVQGQEEKIQNITDPRKALTSRYRDGQNVGQTGQRSVSDNISSISRGSTPRTEHQARRSASNTSISRLRTPEPLRVRPDSPGSYGFRSGTNTPPLRRVGKRMSGDLRSISSSLSNSNTNIATNPNPSRENLHQDNPPLPLQQQSTQPVANEGRVRTKDMADVYDGFGEGRIGSPRSPTRPQSMRRRQSMQVLELESRVEQLIAENRALADAKSQAEQNLNHQAVSAITERDAEIESLKASLEWLRKEVTRLTEVNDGLNSANKVLALQSEKFGRLESQHASTSKELFEHRSARDQYSKTIQEKDAEIQALRAQLEETKEQVKEMQRQILAQKPPDADFLRLKDEDHFDHRCQQLCSHVQQWVLRFSKFSDMRACRLTSEINDEKIIDRLDNSVLDGSDVDDYLSDRVRRRDIFMSMTMNMIWEFVFTRYLFGMDREQRQKLKSLEKLLLEVGPPHAVRQWRAVTLTLLSKRPAFGDQRNQDTEAVVQAVFQTLCMILPPPSNLEGQILSQLRRVMREAVDLSIEMRTQRAEYMMLPPLQPEYDANGDLAQTVTFNAALMNERSGGSTANDDYEAQGAVVRTVLFPLVVKKGDDNGVGDDEVVICPAQVLVAKHPRHARMVTPSSDNGGVPLSRGATPSVAGAPSTISLQMQDAPLPIPTPPHEADYREGGDI